MSFETYLKNPIPFQEACAFLVEFHKMGSEMDGVVAPAPDTLGLYAAVAAAEFKSVLAYTVYGQTLRDLARESLAQEFQEHADDELEHAEFILRRMAVLGGQPPLPDIPMPVPASDPVEIVNNLIQIEMEGIAAWQALHASLGEDPARFKVEEYLAVEQEHLDDMLRLLPDVQAAAPAPGPAPVEAGAPPPAAGPPAAPAGDSGASVKVDLKPGGGEKIALSLAANEALARKYMGRGLAELGVRPELLQKTAFAEKMLPGTEGYYSDRMRSVLEGLAPKVFTPEGALEGVTNMAGEKLASVKFKHALAEMMASPTAGMPPQANGEELQGDPKTQAYLQAEMEGQGAQQQNEAEYYKQRFAEASQQLEAATQASEQAAQQAQQLQQQSEQNQLALTSAQNQAQQTSAMAMQQVMSAGDEKLQQQMQAAQMRMAFQDLRGQLMGLASQEPPSQVLQDPAAQGAQNGMAPQVDPATGQPMAPPQDPAAAGAAPADPSAAPAQPDQAGAAPEAPAASAPEADKGKGGTSVTVKHGSVASKAIGAGVGALVGGGATALESSGHGDSMRAGLKKNISMLEQEQGSFPQAMRLVASKAMLQGSEAAKQHPVGATIMGSLAGAGIGAATEPAVRSLVESGRRLFK